MPHSVQHFEEEFIRYGQLAARALLNHVANLPLHPANSPSRLPTQSSVRSDCMYAYVKRREPRMKFMRVTLLRARWEVRRTLPAAERDGKMGSKEKGLWIF